MRKLTPVGLVTLMIVSLVSGQTNVKLPSVPLNHFYVVLDSATYKAIEQSPFLRKEFAVNEQRTTTRTDISYTGVYFYGTNTWPLPYSLDSRYNLGKFNSQPQQSRSLFFGV
jgi:hypothetical protein